MSSKYATGSVVLLLVCARFTAALLQGVEPGLSVLPSFSVYEQGCLKGHFIGLESTKDLAWKLQHGAATWGDVDVSGRSLVPWSSACAVPDGIVARALFGLWYIKTSVCTPEPRLMDCRGAVGCVASIKRERRGLWGNDGCLAPSGCSGPQQVSFTAITCAELSFTASVFEWPAYVMTADPVDLSCQCIPQVCS